ncbi:rhodanese-related sulfurtransferase [Streptomyces sp. LBL]|uniref:rhodanese-like domain-containing protein n=1 Tax=Streptomyces sp. LBL TaxID=2940562 RepID=UPI002474C148|nr:rhodanese-like domain-containing protein [Streptomyces sp. LBL]MDH6622617.1 rhodanese-related sulfurtransferase [Streptomyces sp. LBL]
MPLFGRGPGRLTPQQARERTTDNTTVLLDVRETPEWKAGHAPGAVHLPLTRLLAGAALPAQAQGRPVVTVCRSGHRSRQAAELLASRGVDVLDVRGGMSAWAKAGLPVVDERGRGGSIA